MFFIGCTARDMLSVEGKEELAFGIDETASLHDGIITHTALDFLEAKYDEYLKFVDFRNNDGCTKLENLYAEFNR